jgi:hypothetical protein
MPETLHRLAAPAKDYLLDFTSPSAPPPVPYPTPRVGHRHRQHQALSDAQPHGINADKRANRSVVSDPLQSE